MDKKDVEFVDGLIVKAPRQGAPDFVKATISIKRADLGNWLRGKTDEWINVDVKESRAGKWYAAVDDWKPPVLKDQAAPAVTQGGFQDDDLEDIPF